MDGGRFEASKRCPSKENNSLKIWMIDGHLFGPSVSLENVKQVLTFSGGVKLDS